MTSTLEQPSGQKQDAARRAAPTRTALTFRQRLSRWDVRYSPYFYVAPFFVLFGLVALSYMWSRMVKAVLKRQAAGTSTPALDAKLELARFFNARVLPEALRSQAHLSG